MNEETSSRATVTQPRPVLSHVLKPPLEISSGAMLASGASIGAVRLASDVIQHVWWPEQAPFSFDVDTLASRLQAVSRSPVWTPWRVRRYRAWAMTFFQDIGDGQWTPKADYYQLPKRITREVTAAMRG